MLTSQRWRPMNPLRTPTQRRLAAGHGCNNAQLSTFRHDSVLSDRQYLSVHQSLYHQLLIGPNLQQSGIKSLHNMSVSMSARVMGESAKQTYHRPSSKSSSTLSSRRLGWRTGASQHQGTQMSSISEALPGLVGCRSLRLLLEVAGQPVFSRVAAIPHP
jgi:hypothetical protein